MLALLIYTGAFILQFTYRARPGCKHQGTLLLLLALPINNGYQSCASSDMFNLLLIKPAFNYSWILFP